MGTVSQAELKRRIRETMEEQVSTAVLNDFIESTIAVVEDAVAEGDSVSLFGLAKINLKFKAASRAQRNAPNPFKPGETYDKPAKPAEIRVKINPLQRLKAAVPSANSAAGKRVKG